MTHEYEPIIAFQQIELVFDTCHPTIFFSYRNNYLKRIIERAKPFLGIFFSGAHVCVRLSRCEANIDLNKALHIKFLLGYLRSITHSKSNAFVLNGRHTDQLRYRLSKKVTTANTAVESE